jgi:predicted DNA-binding transcriptional regulator AlpA
MPDMQPADILTVNEIAELAGVTRLTVRQWTHRHAAFPTPWKTGQPGEPHLYLRADVERWLRETGRVTVSLPGSP